jgi:ATP-dependent Clp protease protease subunit
MASNESDSSFVTKLETRLLESRTIMISEAVTSRLTRRVVASLLLLDQEDPAAPINVIINSPGGSADDGFGIYDAMRFVRAPVRTICVGIAASAATIILLGADKEHRFVLPSCRILIHQPSSGARGSASDISITAKEIIKLRERINKLLAAETGQTVEKIDEDVHRDYWMSAEEAVEYGLYTRIVNSVTDVIES